MMNKEALEREEKNELLKGISTYCKKDLEDVLELLEIINSERINNENHNDALTWSAIKGTAKKFSDPKYAYVEVYTHDNTLTSMITKSIDEMKLKGYMWHDTQYQLGNKNDMMIHSALLIFKKY